MRDADHASGPAPDAPAYESDASEATDVVTFGVAGMRCNNCAAGITKRLEALPGVREARVSYALEDARIRFVPSQIDAAILGEEIERGGFRLLDADAHRDQDGLDPTGEAEHANRLRRMWVGVIASAAVMFLGMAWNPLGLPNFPARVPLIAALAALVLVFVGRDFHLGAWRAARELTTNMDTLVSLGATVAFAYSLGVLLLGLDPSRFPVYFESTAMIITLVMVGKVLEARGKREASGAVRALLAERPGVARVERGTAVLVVPVEEVRIGDRVHIRPGERIPADGVVVVGQSHLDESMLTGESRPVAKRPGDSIHTGTINRDGALILVARATGEATLLADIARLVREAQATQAPIQAIVDRIASVFVPSIIVAAGLIGLAWWGFGAERYLPATDPLAVGILFSASTLLISCPCAMGLATPLALVAGTGVGAHRGLLIKSARALESIGGIDTLVLDKTGTLTLGRPTVSASCYAANFASRSVLDFIIAIERESEHPLAEALVSHADQSFAAQEVEPARVHASDIVANPGSGISGIVQGQQVRIGNRLHASHEEVDLMVLEDAAAEADRQGHASIFVTIDGQAAAHFAVGDLPDPSAAPALARLRNLGLELCMLTGDGAAQASAMASRLGLTAEEVISEMLPTDKAEYVRKRTALGERVAMVGDGINDAPALAAAEVGIAIGSGTNIAIEAADLVLVHDDLRVVAEAILLSRRTLRTIQQNLFWAFGYNVAAIPLAAGLLVPWGGDSFQLSPGVASLAMALSSLFVVGNSTRLRRFDPSS